jgi:hypothetical protein
MASRSLRSLSVVSVLAGLAMACGLGGVGCGPSSRDGTSDPESVMRSAGGLSESRLPFGIWGQSPAPTGALPKDKALQQGWYKHAQQGDKAPTAGDRASM